MEKRKKQRGPKPDKLKIEGGWEDAIRKAIKKPKPEGWPDRKK